MTKLHLVVLQSNVPNAAGLLPMQALWNDRRTEFVWNDTFTAFRLIALKWWDDASYIDYELDGVDTDNYCREWLEDQARLQGATSPRPTLPPPPPAEDDGLLF